MREKIKDVLYIVMFYVSAIIGFFCLAYAFGNVGYSSLINVKNLLTEEITQFSTLTANIVSTIFCIVACIIYIVCGIVSIKEFINIVKKAEN